MTSNPKFRIGTDLLWNSEYPEDYARLVEKADSNHTFASEEELEEHIFRWYPTITEAGVEKPRSREADKLGRNLYGVELVSEDPPEVYLRGLHLFEQTASGYQLSEHGRTLKTIYEDTSEGSGSLEWQSYLSELVCRYFVRIRTLLYYVGVHGYQLQWNWQGGTFTGTGRLARGAVSYPFYIVSGSRNSARTFEGLSKQINWDEYPFDATVIRRMYDLEIAWFSEEHELPADTAERVVELRSTLRSLALETDDSPSEGALRNLLKEMDDLQESAPNIPQVRKRFDNALNLLLDANRRAIVGPWNIDSAEKVLPKPIERFEISGRNQPQPKGKHILVVVRRGLKPLVQLGVLAELDDQVWGIDTDRAEQLFASDLCENLFTAEFSVERDDVFLEQLEETCFGERMNAEGYVNWPQVRQALMDTLEIESRSEFSRKMEEHINAGAIEIRGIRTKNAWMEDGPPGYEKYGTVRLRFNY